MSLGHVRTGLVHEGDEEQVWLTRGGNGQQEAQQVGQQLAFSWVAWPRGGRGLGLEPGSEGQG